jgi:hypothetical protein
MVVRGHVSRLGDVFLSRQGALLRDHGFQADPGVVERTGHDLVFYHFTRSEHLPSILAPDGGLMAVRAVVGAHPPIELVGGYWAEGLLEPRPRCFTACPYFGTLPATLLRRYVGDLLLRVAVPTDFPSLYVGDYAHLLECIHLHSYGHPMLGLGYVCGGYIGDEAVRAFLNSLMPLAQYHGGHVCPVVQAVRKGRGVVVPSRCISIAPEQPWQNAVG